MSIIPWCPTDYEDSTKIITACVIGVATFTIERIQVRGTHMGTKAEYKLRVTYPNENSGTLSFSARFKSRDNAIACAEELVLEHNSNTTETTNDRRN